jgi:DNA-binding response OmpR family regulator
MALILVADDERDLVWAVQRTLTAEGYEVQAAYDGVDALTLARRHRPDLAILDIVMPGLSGLEVCRLIREDPTLADVPVMFMSIQGRPEERVRGLREGRGDYLVKPFDFTEMKVRARNLLERQTFVALDTSRFLVAGPLKLDKNSFQVTIDDRAVRLTRVEFSLLYHLMCHPSEVFSSQELLQQVWGYPPETADPGLVRWHVKRLREKIEPDAAHPVYIRTIPRHGYTLGLW